MADTPQRIASIDTLRGLTIFTMIFVNDAAGVVGVPDWMKHYHPYDADGMTFVDVVFPAFLFIVGMAIPFSLGKRLESGESSATVWGHLLKRVLWLLVIGVCMVNGYSKFADDALLDQTVWSFLMLTAIILTWNSPPCEPGRARTAVLALRGLGIAMIVFLSLVYDNAGIEGGSTEMRTQWWGIIGLIGLAYLVAGTGYMFLRKSLCGMVTFAAILFCFYMADKAGTFSGLWLRSYVDFGTYLGGQSALVVLGMMLGTVLSPNSSISGHWPRIRWALLFSASMVVAGWLIHQLADIHKMFIINKNEATPTWCLYSAAITTVVWVLVYLAMDVRGWRKWALPFEPGGANPLFAYMLHPLVIHGCVILGWIIGTNPHAELGTSFAVGFFRALAMAFGMTWLAGWFMRHGVRLKL